MAIIKCKMCGGDLELVPDATVCECEYCGTRQTVPAADDEKKLKLFERANRLRRACEFDKAAGVYESIVADFDTESEAYWGLVLCKFGIEYVDDPATGKKVPTCHRAGFESVEDDTNFEQACENADAVARRVYREEGRAIDALRERILEVSGKEEPYDIFISYKELAEDGERTEDSVLAQDIYDALTVKGYRVFFSRITLEDKLGVEYEPYIFAALNSAKVMLLVGMDYENLNAVWVKNEWSRYLALMAQNKEKVLIPCYRDMDPYDLPKEVRKLAAQDMGKVGAMQDLLRGVEKIIPLKTAEPAPVTQQPVVMSGGPNVIALQKRGVMALEDAQWDAAKDFFNQVLNMDAENAEAWLGLAMADMKLQHESMFSALQNGQAQADGNASYRRFLRFAPPERVQQIKDMLAAAEAKKQKRMAEETERKAAEEIRRQQEAEEQRQRELKAAVEREARAAAEREAQRKKQEAHINELKAARERIAPVHGCVAAGNLHTVGLRADGTVLAVGANGGVSGNITMKLWKEDGRCDVSDWSNVVSVCVCGTIDACIIGLKRDGTCALTRNLFPQIATWRNIVAIEAGFDHVVGLKEDGTVVADLNVSAQNEGQCAVSDWSEIVAVSAGHQFTVGLRADGTVVATGKNDCGQCNVSEWKNVAKIVAGFDNTFGLRTDGSVIATGNNKDGKCNVSGWNDIIAISAGNDHTTGLKTDGTVVAVGDNMLGQCDVSKWRKVVSVLAKGSQTLGLLADGTVVAAGAIRFGRPGDYSEWTDIVAIAAGSYHAVGLKSDGTLVSCGENEHRIREFIRGSGAQFRQLEDGRCNIADWKLFDSIDTIEDERAAAKERYRVRLKTEQKELEEELPTIKGMFSGSKRAKLEARLAEIEAELKSLGAE